MRSYDAIVVLGSQPNPNTWLFPQHIYKSLDKALELYRAAVSPYIVVSGNYALKFDNIGVKQPKRECDMAEQYLVSQGCPAQVILKEGRSKDTISNFYYLKNEVFKPKAIRDILLVTSGFRFERLRLIQQKVLGPDYSIAIKTIPNDCQTISNEAFLIRLLEEFLATMPDGDDGWLKDKFYDAPIYQYWKRREQAEAIALNSFV